MDKLNKTFSSLPGAYAKQQNNIQVAYKNKEHKNSVLEDLNTSKNMTATEAAAFVNEIKYRKSPYYVELKKLKISESDINSPVNNFYNIYTSDKNSKKHNPVSIKANLTVSNLNTSNLNSSIMDSSFVNNRNLEKSTIGFNSSLQVSNLPMHINSISITSKNNKAQVYTTDFNYYIIGAKKNKRNSSATNFNNYQLIKNKQIAYSRDSSDYRDKRNQSSDYISNTDNTSKKSNYENEEMPRDIKFKTNGYNNKFSNNILYNNYNQYNSNTISNNKRKLNNSHVIEREFSDDYLSSDVLESKKNNPSMLIKSNNHNNPRDISLNLSDKKQNNNYKLKERKFVIENQNFFSEISGLNISNSNLNNLTFMSTNNNENTNIEINLHKNQSIDQERNFDKSSERNSKSKDIKTKSESIYQEKNLNSALYHNSKLKSEATEINFEEYNKFEKMLSERLAFDEKLKEANLKLNEFSDFNQRISAFFNNQIIEQDENFKYKKFVDERFPPSYKSFFSIKSDTNNHSIVTDDSDETIKQKKNNIINSGKFNNIIFKRPSDIYENYNYNIFYGKLESCVYSSESNHINPAFNTVLNTLIDKFPFLLYRIFRTFLINYSGYYEVSLYINNKWQIMPIDDFLPYDNKIKSFNSNIKKDSSTVEIWKLLLEKAIAKAYGGYVNYILLEPHTLFNLITGFNSVIFENSNFDLFTYIIDCLKNNFCLCAKSPNSLIINNCNLPDDYYLSIKDAFEIIDENNDKINYKILKLRKPNENFNFEFELKNFDFIPSSNENIFQEILKKEDFDTFGYSYLKYSDFQSKLDNLYCCMSFVNDENLKNLKKQSKIFTINRNINQNQISKGNSLVQNKNETDTQIFSINKNSILLKNESSQNESQIKNKNADPNPNKDSKSNESNFESNKNEIIADSKNGLNSQRENNHRSLDQMDRMDNKITNNLEKKESPIPVKSNVENPNVKKEAPKLKRKGSHDFGPEKIDIDSGDEVKPVPINLASEREAFKAKFQSYINKANEKEKKATATNNTNSTRDKNLNSSEVKKESIKSEKVKILSKETKIEIETTNNEKTKDSAGQSNEIKNQEKITQISSKTLDNSTNNFNNSNINSNSNSNCNSYRITENNTPVSNSISSTPEFDSKNNQGTPIFKKEEKKSALKKLKEFEMGTSDYKKMEKMKQMNEKNSEHNANKGLTSEQIYENLRKENKKENLVNNVLSSNQIIKKEESLKSETKIKNPEANSDKKNENIVDSLKEIVDKNKKQKKEEDNRRLEMKRIEEEKRIKEIILKNEMEYEKIKEKEISIKNNDKNASDVIPLELENNNKNTKTEEPAGDIGQKNSLELSQKLTEKINQKNEENKIEKKKSEAKIQHEKFEIENETEIHEKIEDENISKVESQEQIDKNLNIVEITTEKLESDLNNIESKNMEQQNEIIDLSDFNTEFSDLRKSTFKVFKYFKDLKPKINKGEKFLDNKFPPEIRSFINNDKYSSPLNKDLKKTPSLFSNAANIINTNNDTYDNSKVKTKLLSQIKTEDIIFKRASEVFDNFKIIVKGIENLELTKSIYEQCLYCVLSCLANSPQIIFNLIRTLEKNDYGFYEVNLFIDGIWQIFYLDDFFPFSIQDNKFIGYSNIDDQLWPMLLEKAFAKACGGYYEMYCTDCSKFLSAFTGMESGHVKIIKNEIFDFIYENIKKKFTLICNTKDFAKNSSNQVVVEKFGLKPSYYYVILDAFELEKNESKSTKLVKIGCPWEKVEFKGEWSIDSPNWDENLKKKYFNNTSKTKFGYEYLTIDEFVKNFDTVFFNLNPFAKNAEENCIEDFNDDLKEEQIEFESENIKQTIYRTDLNCFAMNNHQIWINQKLDSYEFKKRFSDPFFPPNKNSLYSLDKQGNDLIYENARIEYELVLKSKKYENIIWYRISEIEDIKEKADLSVLEDVNSSTKWSDVFEQTPFDSYFQTILVCLLKKPAYIDKLIRTKKINKFCYYEVLLFIDNTWKIVFVDDFVPYDIERNEFLGVKPFQNQIWPLILQKAWAKVCGGYLNLTIMNPTSCFCALTGFESGLYETAKIDLFQFVYDSLKNGYFLVAKTKREYNSLGAQSNFYYVLTNCFETNQNGHFFKLLKIRSPWNGFDWSGQWSLSSSIWEEDKKQIMWKKSIFAKNGFFIVNYEEFTNNFDCLFFCFTNMNLKEENKLPNFQLEFEDGNINNSSINSSLVSTGKKSSGTALSSKVGELKKLNCLTSSNYADLQMMKMSISTSSYFSTTKYITPINGFNKYDNSAENLNLDKSDSLYFWNLEARSTSNILDIFISKSNQRKKSNEKVLDYCYTPGSKPPQKDHSVFIEDLLQIINDYRKSNSKTVASQDEKNLIRLLKEEKSVASLLFSLEPGSPLDSKWYYKELKNNGVWLSQYDIGNNHMAFHALKKHIRMGIYKGNLQWGRCIVFEFFYDDENSNFFYSFDGINIDGQKQGEGKYFKKIGSNYYANEIVEVNFTNNLVQTGKFLMPDGCIWTGPVKNDIYKNGTGTIKTPDGKSWQCTYNMDTFIK